MTIERNELVAAVTMIVACLILPSSHRVTGAEPDATFRPEQLAFFEQEIRPLLADRCFKCHGVGQVKGELSLASREGLLKGGESGPAIDVDDPSSSLLLEAVRYESFEMPPTGKLPQQQIDAFVKWVEMSAPMPAGILAEEHDDGGLEPQVTEQTKQHWSFRPVQKPDVPTTTGNEWVRNPIDAFVFAKLEEADLRPAPEADRQTLIRRLSYDLTGLPPSPDDVAAFEADESPTAYEQLVERLLNSPRHGEHWARYWLDLVRYAETNSFERDNPKPFVWRYRDYVIRSFNDDKPYDQFLREQLAGDELDDVTPESLIATGYYRLGLWDDEPADPKLAFYDGLDDIVGTTGQALLGLSMNCARCHSHKLDPIPHEDYYRFLAFFRNLRHYGQRSDASVFDASVREIDLPEERAKGKTAIDAHRQQVKEAQARIRRIERQALEHLTGGERDDFQDQSARLDILKRGVGKLVSEEKLKQYVEQKKQLERLEQNPPTGLAQVLVVKEQGAKSPPTHVLLRGSPTAEGDLVEPRFPSVLSPPSPDIRPPASGASSGRRRALAEWITSPDNPLTARVMVNRIWQWHFGRGLVRTPNNFGLTGSRPTHPELLDWLTAEFVEQGWSLKATHRLILLSSTYRMASQTGDEVATTKGLQSDPTNDRLWRFDMRRLRAEEVRDSILAVVGTLNTDKMYGPSMYTIMPEEVLAGQSRPGEGWKHSPQSERNRRSLYIHVKRSLKVPILAAFDVADTEFTCPIRFATTQPTQALGMLNSKWVNEQAERFVRRLRQDTGDDPSDQVPQALHLTLQRKPTAAEIDRGLKLMQNLKSEHGLSDADALHYFCLTALNLNEFLYLD